MRRRGASTSPRPLAQAIQDGVVAAMDGVADYDRQDRGIQAHNLFIVAPPLLETTPDRPDPRKQPTRGALMPSVLTEVGSITHRAEQDLLASETGQQRRRAGHLRRPAGPVCAIAPSAAAYLVPSLEPMPGTLPAVEAGDGPMFWAPPAAAGPLQVRLTNTGTESWPSGLTLAGGWEASDQPYLRVPPASLEPLLDEALPALGPGESVDVAVTAARNWLRRCAAVAWITLADGDRALDRDWDPAPAGGHRRLTVDPCVRAAATIGPARSRTGSVAGSGARAGSGTPSNNAGERSYCLIRSGRCAG